MAGRRRLKRDPRSDREAADDLERGHLLGEDQQREQGAEKRLEVRVEGGARRPDAVDRREPEHVRDHERADDRDHEDAPDERLEVPVLRGELVGGRREDQRGAHQQPERRDAKRRVAPHEGRDRNGVDRPGRRAEKRQEDPLGAAGDFSMRAERDEGDAQEADGGRCDEALREQLDARHPRDQHREDRQRPENERGRARSRVRQRVDEPELVEPDADHRGAEQEQQVATAHAQRALEAQRDRAEEQRGAREPDRRSRRAAGSRGRGRTSSA